MGLTRRGDYVVGTIAYPGSAKASPPFMIPMGQRFLKRLWLFGTGSLVITGGTGAGTIDPDNIVALVRSIILKRNGVPIKVGSGRTFFRLHQRYDRTLGRNQGIAVKTAGTQVFSFALPLYFEAPSSVSPTDTFLDERLAGQQLELDVTWGDGTDVIHGSDATSLVFTNTQLSIAVQDSAVFATGAPFWTFQETEATLAGVVTSQQSNLVLPWQDGQVIRSILLQALDGGVPSDAILSAITVQINTAADQPVQAMTADLQKIISDALFGSQIADPVGYYMLELAEQGRVATTGLGARLPQGTKINSLSLILNTTVGAGATSVIAHVSAHVPPSAYPQAA